MIHDAIRERPEGGITMRQIAADTHLDMRRGGPPTGPPRFGSTERSPPLMRDSIIVAAACYDQTRVLHIDLVAAAVRVDGIIGATDLQDMATSIDAGELDWVGPGEDVWHTMAAVADLADVSAQFVADETTHYLGW